jgi:low affinity Fe/Cu permease
VSGAFARWAARIAFVSGYWQTFVLMTGLCVLWAVSGPFFGFSDTWQLVINTATTVLTFLMVFLIQNTQNRDSVAVHLKLDEIIRAIEGAENAIIAAEDASDEELAEQMEQMRELAKGT